MNSNIVTNHKPHPQLPREFWEALLNIHNCFFDCVLEAYHTRPNGKDVEHLLRSFRTLDCWLDVAISEAWLE